MKFVMRGTMAHIIIREGIDVTEIFQDIMLRPPEKYDLEVHLDRDREVISVVICDTGGNIENIIKILEFFIKKYKEQQDNTLIAHTFRQIIKELRITRPMFPKKFFWLDRE